MASNWRAWVGDRFGLGLIKTNILDRRVAKGRWYYGDGAALMLLLSVQVATGAIMMLTYAPSPDAAYESVRHISEEQPLGWFVRGLHYWSAGMMVIMLFWHLFRQLLLGGYKSPREGTWLLGVGLFVLVLIMAYTGYLLRWDERAVYGIRVALHALYNVPLIGEHLVLLVQGDTELGQRTLTRIFAIHVILIPLLLGVLVAWHLYLVLVHGVTSIAERRQPVHSADEQRKLYDDEKVSEDLGETFHPGTTARSGGMATAVFLIVVVLALYLGPRALQPEGNLTSVAFPAEEWWFWWVSGLIALLPAAIAPWFVILAPLLVLGWLVALPFVDRSPYRGVRKRPLAAVLVLRAIITMAYLTDLRRQSTWTAWPSDIAPPVPKGVTLSDEAELGRHLFVQYGCNSCHAVGAFGQQFGPDLAQLSQRYSQDELRQFILRPPQDATMPSYEDRITQEDLERIVLYVLAAQTFTREP